MEIVIKTNYTIVNSTTENKVIEIIQNSFNNNFNTGSIDNGTDHVITIDSIIYTITSTKNQERQKDDNITTIDLGNCATKLKKDYNIFENESLYILMIDMSVDGLEKVEYEVYYNFSSNNLTKLNLSLCEGIKIDISLPRDIPLSEIDKYI